MYCQVDLVMLSPIKLLKTSFIGIETEPRLIFNKKIMNNKIVKIKNKIVFLFLIFKIILVAQKTLLTAQQNLSSFNLQQFENFIAQQKLKR